ncbi:MAG: MarR family winged helix-turn-helix transcriptional regulator [Candidatus Sericytochromatia bacterium]
MSTTELQASYCRCLFYAANALARNIGRLADEAFASTGLTSSYAFLLMSVNRQPGIQPSEIARVMMLTPSTVTRLVDKLESKGYLERRSAGKASHIHPTSRSLALDADLRAAWKGLFDQYAALLGEAEATELTAAVFEAAQRLEAGEA